MTLYLAEWVYAPDSGTIGIFSSHAKALEATQKHDQESRFQYGYEIYEFELDEEIC